MGILVLAVALFIPTIIDATAEDQTVSDTMTVGDTTELTDRLSVTLDDVNQSSGNINLTYINTQTQDKNQTTVGETNTKMVTLSGETINATNEMVESTDSAIVTSEYPPMFGWSSGARTFFDHFPLIMGMLAFAMAVGVVLVGWKQ